MCIHKAYREIFTACRVKSYHAYFYKYETWLKAIAKLFELYESLKLPCQASVY